MDLDDALAALGLPRDTTWAEVRAAYRARIRTVHPDVADASPVAAAELNAAFATLERVYRRGQPPVRGARPDEPRPAPPDRHRPPEPPLDFALVDDDGLALVAPADEVFLRLAAVIDEVGDVTYADPDGGYLEALVAGGSAQLVVSLQGRAHATEAFFTLEPMGARPAPPIETIVRQIAARLRAIR